MNGNKKPLAFPTPQFKRNVAFVGKCESSGKNFFFDNFPAYRFFTLNLKFFSSLKARER